MYRIITKTDGQLVGYTEEPIYIRKHPNGCYVQTSREKAEGISYKSTPYSLGGLNGVDEVLVVQQDANDIYMDIKTANEHFALVDETAIGLFEAQANLEDQLAQADETNIALFEAQAAQEEINTAQDEALIALFELIGGEE